MGLRLSAWIKIVSIAVLFCFLFWSNLARLWLKTNPFSGEDNWKHAIFVPLLGLYYLYVNREQLLSAEIKTTWWGLGIMLVGILLFGYAIWPLQNDWFKDLGMVITLFGAVTFLCGWEVMKTAWFPIAFLICALPWPGLFYSMLAGPLQELAARVAVRLMNFVGVQSGQFGTKIFVEGRDHAVHTLNVAEACAGLRSLMTFIFIAGAVAFLSYRPLWQKFTMVFSAIPIAIFCNTMRVTVQGILARYASMQWAEGAAHGMVGLVMMIPAFFLILLVGWILQNIFIEEVDDKSALRLSKPSTMPSGRPAQTRRVVSRGSEEKSSSRVTTQAIATARAVASRQPPLATATASAEASPELAAPAAARKAAPANAAGVARTMPATGAATGPGAPQSARPAAGTTAPAARAAASTSKPAVVGGAAAASGAAVKKPATPATTTAPAKSAKPVPAQPTSPAPTAAKPSVPASTRVTPASSQPTSRNNEGPKQ
jgi:exosortase